jgi:hypothetical protein
MPIWWKLRQTHRRIYSLKNGVVKPYAEKPRYN